MGQVRRFGGGGGEMDDDRVLRLFNEAMAPYHDSNTEKFEHLFRALNMVKGAVVMFTVFVGIPGAIASIWTIVNLIKGK